MVKRKNDNEHESRLDYDQAGAVEEQSASGGGGTFAKADSATLASRRRVHATVVHAGGRGSRAYRKHNYLKELTKLNAKFKTFVNLSKDRTKKESEALKEAYGLTYRQLDEKWRGYVTGGFQR